VLLILNARSEFSVLTPALGVDSDELNHALENHLFAEHIRQRKQVAVLGAGSAHAEVGSATVLGDKSPALGTGPVGRPVAAKASLIEGVRQVLGE